jgi:putative ABC transport system ATP-binding protein
MNSQSHAIDRSADTRSSVGASGQIPTKFGESTGKLLEIKALGKRFADRTLFQSIDFELAPGEQIALIGESGSGKSTLLNLIAGLDSPSEGHISIAGLAIEHLSIDACARLRRERIGFVFQAFHLLPHLDATQNVALPLLLNQQKVGFARQESRALLTRLGLGQRLDAMPSELSGGEQQRVALARALIHRPSLVLADEPTGNLDTDTAREALNLMFDTCRGQGSALLMVTHSDFAASRCQKVFKLSSVGLHQMPTNASTAHLSV